MLASGAVSAPDSVSPQGRPSPLRAVTGWDQLSSEVAWRRSPAGCLDLARSFQLPGVGGGLTLEVPDP